MIKVLVLGAAVVGGFALGFSANADIADRTPPPVVQPAFQGPPPR